MNGEKWGFSGKRAKPDRDGPPGADPRFKLPLWHILFMLLLLWIWQDALSNYTVKTLPYSTFKEHVRQGEVTEIKIGPQQINGKITLKPGSGSTNTTAASIPAETNKTRVTTLDPDGDPNTFLFRTTRVEDPDLVKELEKANVAFTGVRPSFLSQFI